MFPHFPWIVFFLFIGAATALGVALLARGRSNYPGNITFTIFMTILSWWAFAYAFELLTQQPDPKLIWAKLQYLAIPFTTPFLLMFVAAVSEFTWQRSRRVQAAILTIPVITSLMIWIRAEWIWAAVKPVQVGEAFQYSNDYGPWFFVHTLYSWALFFVAFALIIRLAFNSPSFSRIEVAILVISILIPFTNNVSYIIGIDLTPGYDLTPLFLVTFGLGASWVLFEFRPNDLTPFVYYTAFNNLPDPAMMLDESDRIRTVNPAAEQYFGKSASELNRRPITNLLPRKWLDILTSSSENQSSTIEVSRTIDDKTAYYALRMTTILDRRARSKGRLFVIHDITVTKQALLKLAEREQALSNAVDERTSELQAINQELERAVRLKDEFLANMSHELRTPLNAVIGTTESLHAGVYGPILRDQRQPLHRIEDSAKHLLALISDILNVSKIEAGKFILRVHSVSIYELSEACLNLIKVEADRKNITLISSFDLSQQCIWIDERRVRQILLNLFSNAIKFTPQYGKVGLTVRENKEAQQTHFVVWDTGIGIAAEEQKRIFSPFIQVDSTLARQYEGTGLGLALTRGLVEMHGGSIGLLSELGLGSRFTIILPWDCRQTATVSYVEVDPTLQEETYLAL